MSIFVLLLFFAGCAYADIFVLNGTTAGGMVTIDSTPLIFGGNSLQFTTITNVPVSLVNSAIPGSAVFLPLSDVSEENILRAMDAGAVAIIYSGPPFFSSNVGCTMYFNYARSMYRVTIPVVEVSFADADGVLNETVSVTITSTHNPCHAFYTSAGFVIVQTIVCVLSLMALVLCGIRLFQFYQANLLFRISLAIVAILIEVLSNAFKFIYVINLFGTNLLYSPKFDDFILYASFPLSTITNVMIIMYWHEALVAKGLQIHVFLKAKKFRITFAVLSFILIGFDLMTATLRVVNTKAPKGVILLMNQIFGIIANFLALVYGIVILVMVFHRAGGFSGEDGNDLLKKILWRLTANSVLLTIFIVSLIAFIVPPSFDLVKATYALGACYASQSLLSILQVFSFQPPKLKKTTNFSTSTEIKMETESKDIEEKGSRS